jgi:oxepin-CoA hydrolase/3-oxo-5,6-dehydrosuberyl-CoA semialdehyde dehydrogenase
VYAGDSIYIRFTCKEKMPQETKVIEGEPVIDKGIVKWLVEIIGNDDEITGIGSILTMVKLKQQISHAG